MLRSRSSGLLPITHSSSFSRHDSRTYLNNLRRGRTGATALQRLTTYVLVSVLLCACVFGVARLGRHGSGVAGGHDDFPLGAALLDGSRVGQQHFEGAAAAGAQQQQQHAPHVHADAHDGRQAMEGGAAAAAAPEAAAQAELEREHVAHLQAQAAEQQAAEQQAGQQQGHDPDDGLLHHRDPEVAAHVAAHIAEVQAQPQRQGPSVYAANLSAVDIHGNVVRTADLAGRVAIIANVASQCGYTEANYQGLHRLYERYKDYGFTVLAFPCNQFGAQEPGSHAEIEAFVAAKFGAQFPLMSKVDVNGGAQHPIFAWLKQHTPDGGGGFQPGEDVRWNFEKFLVDKRGAPVKRYTSDMAYHDLELDVYNELVRL